MEALTRAIILDYDHIPDDRLPLSPASAHLMAAFDDMQLHFAFKGPRSELHFF